MRNDICHMMKSPDESMLSTIGGALPRDMNKMFTGLKQYYPNLQPNTAEVRASGSRRTTPMRP
jgi:hypothetical protein